MKDVRSYELRLYGSRSKFEDLRWSAYQFIKLVNAFISHLYFNDNMESYSTKGLGLLGNQAQRKAKGLVTGKKTREMESGEKKTYPIQSSPLCFASIEPQSSGHEFNFKVWFSLGFVGKGSKSRFLYAKSTRALNQALKQHWKLSNQCEAFLGKNGKWYIRVFVSKERQIAKPQTKSIGVDVGINHIVATSEGKLGNSLSKRLNKLEESRKEKQRQLSLAKNRKDKELVAKLEKNLTKNKNIKKTEISQLLDKEAKRLIARGLATSMNLVVEDPKVLANLKGMYYLKRWAKTYLAYRLQVLGRERGVYVVFANPAYTSQTCYKCGEQDKMSRKGIQFNCQKCGHQDQADLNAAKNLVVKGQDFVDIYKLKIKSPQPKVSAVRAPSGPL